MADYRDHYQELRDAGAELVTVSVDNPSESEQLSRELNLPFRILSDADRRVVREWGVFNQRERGGIAKPSVFILDANRTILFCSIDGVRTRVSAAEVIRALRTPGLNAPSTKFGYTPHLIDALRAIRNNIHRLRQSSARS